LWVAFDHLVVDLLTTVFLFESESLYPVVQAVLGVGVDRRRSGRPLDHLHGHA
jgi:hypothetical protein